MAHKKSLGLYKKYKASRVDGKKIGDAIVLEFKDPIARVGINAWATAMRQAGYFEVFKDIIQKLDEYEQKK